MSANKPRIQKLLVSSTAKVRGMNQKVREENKRAFKTQVKTLNICKLQTSNAQ